MATKTCLCGCGKEFEVRWNRIRNQPTMFVKGHTFRNKHHSEESKIKMSEKNKGKNYSPETQFKIGHKLNKGIPLSEQHKQNLSESHKRLFKEGKLVPYWKGKHFSPQHIQKLRNKVVSEETRKKISETNKGKKLLEETKRKISAKMKGHVFSELHNRKISNARKGIKFSEEHKKRLSETRKILFREGKIKHAMKGTHLSEERKQNMRTPRSLDVRKLISIKTKEAMKNPDVINKMKGRKVTEEQLKKYFLALERRPTSYEKRLGLILDGIQPNEWKYTGDGSFLIGYKNPDFVNVNGKKQVIEVYHNYFKERDYGSEENYKKQRAEHFAKYGYETIFLNGEEYNKEEIVKKKLGDLQS